MLSSADICDSCMTQISTMVVSDSFNPSSCLLSIDAPGGNCQVYQERDHLKMNEDCESGDNSRQSVSVGRSLQSSSPEGETPQHTVQHEGIEAHAQGDHDEFASSLGSLRSREEGSTSVPKQKSSQMHLPF